MLEKPTSLPFTELLISITQDRMLTTVLMCGQNQEVFGIVSASQSV